MENINLNELEEINGGESWAYNIAHGTVAAAVCLARHPELINNPKAGALCPYYLATGK
ncbi:hypothetical protein [Clostridium botulinum]|uniref:hypothetical protein n=1 Tax=Clostridium botulinum TaxID=1491 RepID=UPI00016BBA4B|nr:hypothetical protein [Clostridium botulinum]APC79281.1 hypothetical protein NPD2_3563 [Clostridium botulinum]APC84895.1 hypothetical protein NPD12_1406 [Clostridium botulinum]EDT82607.1 hypothetical protein CBN_1293 [Clostridium botulinum NCTC 2916]MBY6770570.1 hypothetical protein [Clostridium botulinum]MBY6774605.1 hypothetical protein [Clostridium botulinum]